MKTSIILVALMSLASASFLDTLRGLTTELRSDSYGSGRPRHGHREKHREKHRNKHGRKGKKYARAGGHGKHKGKKGKGHVRPSYMRGGYGGCTEGQMFCDSNTGGFYTCNFNRYVLRSCGPGTECQQSGNNVFCNYATGSSPSNGHGYENDNDEDDYENEDENETEYEDAPGGGY